MLIGVQVYPLNFVFNNIINNYRYVCFSESLAAFHIPNKKVKANNSNNGEIFAEELTADTQSTAGGITAAAASAISKAVARAAEKTNKGKTVDWNNIPKQLTGPFL